MLATLRQIPVWIGVGIAVGLRPDLWPSAIAAIASMAPARWWRRWPFLPLPDRRWLHFRMVTAYGGEGRGLNRSDVITWLEWRRQFSGRKFTS